MLIVEYIIKGFLEALDLIHHPYILDIACRSLKVSGSATILSLFFSVPISILIGLYEFKGKMIIKNLINTFAGIPTVIWGLILYLMYVPNGGILGKFDLLYNVKGIILGQALLITPLISSIIIDAIEKTEKIFRKLCYTLGANEFQTIKTILKESLPWILLSGIIGFNRAISELGIALTIGGNVYVPGASDFNTRVLTTAIQMHTVRAEFSTAIALGIILLTIILIVNFITNYIKKSIET